MLFTEGEVAVVLFDRDDPLPVVDIAAQAALRSMDAAAREELAAGAPALDPIAASWAAQHFYRACQIAVCRDAPAEAVKSALTVACPAVRGPSTDWSVDLVFRHLPELFALAQRIAPDDPLVEALRAWALAWPLSSVGIPLPDETPAELASFAGDPALWRLYVDRVARCGASDRWREPRVAAQLRADLGAHPGLDPALAAALDLRVAAPKQDFHE